MSNLHFANLVLSNFCMYIQELCCLHFLVINPTAIIVNVYFIFRAFFLPLQREEVCKHQISIVPKQDKNNPKASYIFLISLMNICYMKTDNKCIHFQITNILMHITNKFISHHQMSKLSNEEYFDKQFMVYININLLVYS